MQLRLLIVAVAAGSCGAFHSSAAARALSGSAAVARAPSRTALDAVSRRHVVGGAAAASIGLGLGLGPVVGPAAAVAAGAALKSASVKLSDGTPFQLASFGLQVYDDERARQYTLQALEAGYRNFFASVLAQNQRGFARAIKESGVPRSELFICGSVLSNRVSGFDGAKALSAKGCRENMEAFATGGIDYIDMIMLDYPGPDAASIKGQWAALTELADTGACKTLAVSNFSPDQLDLLLTPETKYKPLVNQLPLGVGFQTAKNKNLLAENKKRGVLVQAWSPLRTLGPNAKALCADIGAKQSPPKSAQQVALKWIAAVGASYTTQSKRESRIREGIDIFDFSLSADDMAKLSAVEG